MPLWEKTKHGSKSAFDKGWAAFEKLGVPVNKLTNKIGSEAFWPTGLGPESDKAARILKSFCSMSSPAFTSSHHLTKTPSEDGFYKESPTPNGTGLATPAAAPSSPGPRNNPKVLMKIPQKVIQNCVGLAIFSVMRTGLWVSGAGGSGVLIARKEDGEWGPPSGILVHTLGVGFIVGIDIYDCVIVINNRKALEAFSKMRVSLGGELSVVAGPVGAGGIVESELLKDRKPVLSYVKSRGLYGGLQVDGTIIVERNDENAKFYGERLPIKDILAGNIKDIPAETRMLIETVKLAEGRTDGDPAVLEQLLASNIPPPSEVEVERMSEPTNEQRQNFAPPPQYHGAAEGLRGNPAEGYYPPEKHGYKVQHDESPAYTPSSTDEDRPAYPPRPDDSGAAASASASTHTTGADQKIPPTDSALYDPPTPTGSSSPFPLPLNVGKPPARTASGFAPPPGPPPNRTDSGFPAPPPKSEKRDPDAPPAYT
ncbi:hypothetical protein JHW43_002713 [Diplocarpon mali]|nr:hypothetical protein JHW43_002713 [Diplocarpon mali]